MEGAAKKGWRLWRNNSGAVTTEDGRHIRFGLANTSAQLNKKIKSSDLVGIAPTLITPEHVGQTLGVFVSIEVKREGWQYKGTPREVAQLRWLELVAALGGIAYFQNNADEDEHG